VLSYDGKLGFGFTGDLDRVPDLADFVRDLELSFARLRSAALGAARSEGQRSVA
jgi:hypothetical protein